MKQTEKQEPDRQAYRAMASQFRMTPQQKDAVRERVRARALGSAQTPSRGHADLSRLMIALRGIPVTVCLMAVIFGAWHLRTELPPLDTVSEPGTVPVEELTGTGATEQTTTAAQGTSAGHSQTGTADTDATQAYVFTEPDETAPPQITGWTDITADAPAAVTTVSSKTTSTTSITTTLSHPTRTTITTTTTTTTTTTKAPPPTTTTTTVTITSPTTPEAPTPCWPTDATTSSGGLPGGRPGEQPTGDNCDLLLRFFYSGTPKPGGTVTCSVRMEPLGDDADQVFQIAGFQIRLRLSCENGAPLPAVEMHDPMKQYCPDDGAVASVISNDFDWYYELNSVFAHGNNVDLQPMTEVMRFDLKIPANAQNGESYRISLQQDYQQMAIFFPWDDPGDLQHLAIGGAEDLIIQLEK